MPHRTTHLSRTIPALSGGLLLLAGCLTAGPDYRPPQTDLPVRWSTTPGAGVRAVAADAAALECWWTVFNDPVLSDLIERARTGNRDVRQAAARLCTARAQRALSKAGLFPTLSANASASRSRSSREAGGGLTANMFANGFDASWELDLFGGQRRTLEAATATLQAAEEDLRDVLVSLLAETALNYVELRSYQARLSITEASLTSQGETYDITRWRHAAGLTTQLDEDQARRNLEMTRADLPALQTSLTQAQHQLAVLLGQPPGALQALLARPGAVPVAVTNVAVGVPADILRRRPDVRRAERQLAAQTAQIGTAAAARYPNVSLAGSIGLESLTLGNLYTAGARTAQAGASAVWKLFDGGSIRANIEVQTAKQAEVLNAYEAAVLTALKDVEDALTAYANEQTRRQTLVEAQQAGLRAFELARHQYAAGLVDFQTVLDTQRSLLTVQEQLAISAADVTSNLIRLYKALGGGWTAAELKNATARGKS